MAALSSTEAKTKVAPSKTGDLIIGRRVKDTPIFNTYGDKIGNVEDFSIEKTTGKVRYALMSFGGFLGIGEKFHPLPWNVLKYDTERDGYVIGLTKEELADAPSFTTEELSAYGGRDVDYSESIQGFYARFAVPY